MTRTVIDLISSGMAKTTHETTAQSIEYIQALAAQVSTMDTIAPPDDILTMLTNKGIETWNTIRSYEWNDHVDTTTEECIIETGVQFDEQHVIVPSKSLAARLLLDPYYYLGVEGLMIIERGGERVEEMPVHNVTYWKALRDCVKMVFWTRSVYGMTEEEINSSELFALHLYKMWFNNLNLDEMNDQPSLILQ